MNHHKLFEGFIRHRRFEPKTHEFKYSLFQFCLDLDHLDDLKNISPLLSLERFNYLSFNRQKYLDKKSSPLKQAILARIGIETDLELFQVFLLTHLSYLGYCFNPISLFFIYEKGSFKALLADVTNTPWKESHVYVLDKPILSKAPVFYFEAKKKLHVSPFMTMDYSYQFHLRVTDEKIILHINNIQNEKVTFDATLSMTSKPLSKVNLHPLLRKYPLLTQKVAILIHWHAVKLWLKGIPFQHHPKQQK